jgi:hypothetical protein
MQFELCIFPAHRPPEDWLSIVFALLELLMLAGIAQGPGFPNLSCLGLLAAY